MNDIVKGVVYDRGTATLDGKTKYLSLVAMVIASDKPLDGLSHKSEYIVMGIGNFSENINGLSHFSCPFKFGDISHGIKEISHMIPDELNPIDYIEEDYE